LFALARPRSSAGKGECAGPFTLPGDHYQQDEAISVRRPCRPCRRSWRFGLASFEPGDRLGGGTRGLTAAPPARRPAFGATLRRVCGLIAHSESGGNEKWPQSRAKTRAQAGRRG
jgi:hypothetical protein